MPSTTGPPYTFRFTVLKECLIAWCGRVPYTSALRLQLKISDLKKAGFERDVLLLLEHPPVITMGRSADRKNLLADQARLEERGVEVWETDRGGDITFHGPGQLVGYPILALQSGERDVRRYMRNLEESLIQTLAVFGLESTRSTGYTGVWIGSGKIAAMGVHISRWITRHGFALNVNTDLSFFDLIVPCGIAGKSVTSMQKQLGYRPNMTEVVEKYTEKFGLVFGRSMIPVSETDLDRDLDRYRDSSGESAGIVTAGSEKAGNCPIR
jgi:lipoyl(octanoyl) transferase